VLLELPLSGSKEPSEVLTASIIKHITNKVEILKGSQVLLSMTFKTNLDRDVIIHRIRQQVNSTAPADIDSSHQVMEEEEEEEKDISNLIEEPCYD
jgi:hypothetical protein